MTKDRRKSDGAKIILRLGIAFVFFYAAIESLLMPDAWAGFVPSFVLYFVSLKLFLTAFSVFQLILAILIFSGKWLRAASLLATLAFAAIVLVDFGAIDIVFRDIGLAFAALALFEMTGQNIQEHDDL